ncbi:hypothetical protein [Reinekea thalattae]|uniref:MSHA biogenesis protein MshK n=1 Tax=Reinekea thalattae TaxID=2593301 RepID=A0A5C8Z8P7_9GAMM|nr:hypothetical protein [Reinekea thalattae]TXR54302.1 hypothetical protein FME95_07135 [Reinekea thalattae]
MFNFSTSTRAWRFLISVVACLLCLTLQLSSANPMRPDTGKPAVTPTQKPTAVVSAPALPTLSSILIIGDYRVAVFTRGRERTIGQRINGYTVVQIEPEYIVMKQGTREVTLKIKSRGALSITPAGKE